MKITKSSSLLAGMGLAATILSATNHVNADVFECDAAFGSLLEDPQSLALPMMQAATGEFNLAFSYQNPMLAVFPPDTMGSYDICSNAKIFSSGTMETEYCTLSGNAAGMCIPAVCTEDDFAFGKMNLLVLQHSITAIQRIPPNCFLDPYLTEECATLINAKEYFEGVYELITIFTQDFMPYQPQCGAPKVEPDDMSYAMLIFTFAVAGLILIFTMWDEINTYFHTKKVNSDLDISHDKEKNNQANTKKSSLPATAKAFIFTTNFKETFSMTSRGGEFACFDSIRALSCWWVIIYHVILWQVNWLQNPQVLLPSDGYLAEWWSMPMFNFSGTLCVDSFLYISAFLATYLLIMKLDKEEKKGIDISAKRWLPMFYFNRWVRISAAYMFAMFMHWKVAPMFASGPNAERIWSENVESCGDTWWTHLLYINTVYPWQMERRACFGHTWYLADDMMFFFMVPPLVMLFRMKNSWGRPMAYFFTSVFIFGCTIVTGVLAYFYHWAPITWDGAEATAYSQEAFNMPYVRAPAYFVGVALAFIWYEKKQRYPKAKLSHGQCVVAMMTILGLLAVCMYGPYTGSGHDIEPCILTTDDCGSGWSRMEKVLAAALIRPTWSLSLGLLCMMCFNNQGGLIQKFMTASIWMPFSAISFTTYLTHFTVLTFYMGQRTLRIHWELFEFVIIFFGLTIISHILGAIVTLLIEKPAMKLQKVWLTPKPVYVEQKKPAVVEMTQ